MKVLQTIQGMLAKSGGPSTCTRDLMEGLYDLKAGVDLLTFGAKDKNDTVLGSDRPWMHLVENDCKTPMALSKNTSKFLEASDYDLYHCNALWMYSNHITCKVAREKHKPYVLSPHGMLYPVALAIKPWKKWPMLKLWFNKDIHSATCLHATCIQEMEHCRAFGYKGPIAVIPNCVVFPQGVNLELRAESLKYRIEGKKQIGFLGRLHPIKKVENIIYAISMLSKEMQDLLSLQVMGKYDDRYEGFLKAEVKRLKLEDCVTFVGFVSGKEKYDRLAQLSALMVPSEQENFGMIVPEALICGTPVYASFGTPWSELNDCQCGWWKNNEPETITYVIKEILSKNDTEIREMGARGRKLMEEKYEQHKVAGMMRELYRWILGEIDKPEFVFL